ncbi:MAG: hypothetical protein WCW27_02600 [Patescibacteria group bacterium]|jgi:hypothetical protein
MYPGKVLQKLFPNLAIGTHCTINRLARTTLRLTRISKRIPHWKIINEYEGMNGMDGLWIMKEQQLPSHSAYNPVTKQGHGLTEMQEQYQQLVTAWKGEAVSEVPKRLAYLSHIIADVCTPPHQHGKLTPIRKQRWYGFFHTTDDWSDRDTESLLFDNHNLFELNLLIRLMFKPLAKATLYTNFIKEYLVLKNTRSETLKRFLLQEIKTIHGLRVYQDYLRFGWNQRIEQAMRLVVLPKTISLVATYWYLAAREGKRSRRAYFPLASH